MYTIRKAGPADASALSILAEKTFRETFGAANSAQNMDSHCKASYGDSIQAREISNTKMVTLVAEGRSDLIGFAQLCWGHRPECVQGRSPGEVQRIYVTTNWHGTGVASELMNRCLEELKQRGSDMVWLGVWENNPRALAFYNKIGFEAVGHHVFPVGADLQRDVLMARSLSEA